MNWLVNENTCSTCINTCITLALKECCVSYWRKEGRWGKLCLLPNAVCWLVLHWALCLSFVYVWACLLHQFAVLGSQAAQRYAKQPWRVPHRKHEKQPTLAQWATLHTGIYWTSVLAHFVGFFFSLNGFRFEWKESEIHTFVAFLRSLRNS